MMKLMILTIVIFSLIGVYVLNEDRKRIEKEKRDIDDIINGENFDND